MIILSIPVFAALLVGCFIAGMLTDAAIGIKAHLHKADSDSVTQNH